MDFDRFESEMQAFAFGQLQDFVTLMDTLKAKGFTLDDLKLYVTQRQRIRSEQSERRTIVINCPKCEKPMLLRFINIPKGKRNVHGYKSCLECLNCGYEQYSTEHPERVLERYTANVLGSMKDKTEVGRQRRKSRASSAMARCGDKQRKQKRRK